MNNAPIIIEPNENAGAAIIWLHGLGANGDDLVPVVSQLSAVAHLRIRHLFPSAPVRPVTLNMNLPLPAWFDIKTLTPHEADDVQGIHDSYLMIEKLIAEQIASGIASNRIIVAGFSQGGSLAIYTLLHHQHPLAAIIALSTFFPFNNTLTANVSAIKNKPPIFMAHGSEDDVVNYSMGESTKNQLIENGFKVEWHHYPMGHSLCLEEIHDISVFLRNCLL